MQLQKENEEPKQPLSHKERLLKRYRERPLLTGHGEEMAQLRKEFREDFVLQHMANFILDSDILDYLGKWRFPVSSDCLERYSRRMDDNFYISILTVFEFDYRLASCNEKQFPLLHEIKQDMLSVYRILPLPLSISQQYGQLKARYKVNSKAKSKTMKGHTVDIILAATALEHDAVVVSIDRIFSMLQIIEPRLKVENWAR